MLRPRRMLLAALLTLGVLWVAGCDDFNTSTNSGNMNLPTTVPAGGKLRGTITYQNNTGHDVTLMQVNANVTRNAQSFGVKNIDYQVTVPNGKAFQAKIEIDISPQAQGNATVEVQGQFLDQGAMRTQTNEGAVTITR